MALKEDISENRESHALVALDTAEASRGALADGGVVDQASGDDGLVAVDDGGEGGEVGGAREGVAALLLVVLGALDLLVVGADDVVGEEEEGGAGVFCF